MSNAPLSSSAGQWKNKPQGARVTQKTDFKYFWYRPLGQNDTVRRLNIYSCHELTTIWATAFSYDELIRKFQWSRGETVHTVELDIRCNQSGECLPLEDWKKLCRSIVSTYRKTLQCLVWLSTTQMHVQWSEHALQIFRVHAIKLHHEHIGEKMLQLLLKNAASYLREIHFCYGGTLTTKETDLFIQLLDATVQNQLQVLVLDETTCNIQRWMPFVESSSSLVYIKTTGSEDEAVETYLRVLAGINAIRHQMLFHARGRRRRVINDATAVLHDWWRTTHRPIFESSMSLDTSLSTDDLHHESLRSQALASNCIMASLGSTP